MSRTLKVMTEGLFRSLLNPTFIELAKCDGHKPCEYHGSRQGLRSLGFCPHRRAHGKDTTVRVYSLFDKMLEHRLARYGVRKRMASCGREHHYTQLLKWLDLSFRFLCLEGLADARRGACTRRGVDD
jgi:hypothetical protein